MKIFSELTFPLLQCNKNENFRKHMLLLWQNNVSMSIEILLSPDCRVGRAKAHSLEVTTVPEPGSVLLEQWTVAVQPVAPVDPTTPPPVTPLALLQAVRSFLHFSQLSAWYSKTGGRSPWNVLVRLTVPGAEFASKFGVVAEQTELHSFPAARPPGPGQTGVAVSVRSLPRTDTIPAVLCSHTAPSNSPARDQKQEEGGLAGAGSLAWREPWRARLTESEICPGRLTKSDSLDSMLGDSLLDPPPPTRAVPRRYQSPSRCGSPSLEAPEPLCPGPGPATHQDSRLNRADQLRRRDLTLFHGLHPRVLHGQPRLSLPPRSGPPGPPEPAPPPLSDCLPARCNRSGKHRCPAEAEEEGEECRPAAPPSPLSSSPDSDWGGPYHQAELGAKRKGWTGRGCGRAAPYSRDSSTDSSGPADKARRPYKPHRDADCATSEPGKSSRRPSLEEILDPGNCSAVCPSLPVVTAVYRAELPRPVPPPRPHSDKENIQLGALVPRPSNLPPVIHSVRETCPYRSVSSSSEASPLSPAPCPAPATPSPVPTSDINVGDLCQDMESKCLISRKTVEREVSPLPVSPASVSPARPRPVLQPLDFSFDCEAEESWDTAGSSSGEKRRNSVEDEETVPSANKKNAFRKSFDSAASMVFQRRTGLPLTSSPAPMRRGIKFDFDSGIATPKDIKRALFEAAGSPEESECGSPKKKKRDPRRLLSTSAPATVSSNNLLGNFEESVLNGRLEPASTVEGFTAEVGASGSFQPRHTTFPVTVFFYTLCENSSVASPYLVSCTPRLVEFNVTDFSDRVNLYEKCWSGFINCFAKLCSAFLGPASQTWESLFAAKLSYLSLSRLQRQCRHSNLQQTIFNNI